jgi:Ca-activated chloride channel family protein
MKRLGAVAVAVACIFGTALYLHFASSTTSPDTSDPAPPTTEQTRDGTLELNAAISHDVVRTEDSDTLYGTIDLTAAAFEGEGRPPLNVALVLDRSGSMHGDKITHVKQAARTIVDMLDRRDRLAIVSYGGTASVEVPSQLVTSATGSKMKEAIGEIQDAGGTNIAAGVRAGVTEIERDDTPESIDRVILLSDGKPTIGMSSRNGFQSLARNVRRRDGVTLTAMGVGLDYNEDLMSAMAETGGGNYYFIDRPEKAVSIFERELQGLEHTVARDTAVTVELGEGVDLEHLYGYPHHTRDGRIHVSLSEFEARETKSIFVELEIDWREPATRRVMDVDLSYEDLVDDRPAHASLELTSRAMSNPGRRAESVHEEVVSRVQQIEVAESLDRAMEAYERGNRQRAREMLETQTDQLERAEARHQLEGSGLDKMHRKLSETKRSIETTSATSPRGRTIIKRNKARGHRLMRDKSAVDDF